MKTILTFISLLFQLIFCSKLPQNCGNNGLNSTEESFRVIGGQLADNSEFPWTVDIIGHGQCTGSLISEEWVMTAAHCYCVNSSVYLGFTDIKKPIGHEFKRTVIKTVPHPEWEYNLGVNDIQLLKLNETIDFVDKHKYLRPICLPKASDEPKLKDCMATGYGYHEKIANMSEEVLLKVSEPVFDISECDQLFPDIDKERNVCAGGSPLGGKGTCSGDSGGPLQCRSTEAKWYQIGITSRGQPCAHADVPDVFTRVAFYREWIEKVLENN